MLSPSFTGRYLKAFAGFETVCIPQGLAVSTRWLCPPQTADLTASGGGRGFPEWPVRHSQLVIWTLGQKVDGIISKKFPGLLSRFGHPAGFFYAHWKDTEFCKNSEGMASLAHSHGAIWCLDGLQIVRVGISTRVAAVLIMFEVF